MDAPDLPLRRWTMWPADRSGEAACTSTVAGVEPIPAADRIAGVLSDLLMAWDEAIAEHASESAPNSWGQFDQHDYPAHSGIDTRLAGAPSNLAFLTCSSVLQMARSIATLYANSNVSGLTLGHLPLLRSVLEGVGQVRWLIAGEGPIDGPPASVSREKALDASRARIGRACLLWASCFQQAHRDFTAQREVPDARAMKAQLAEWKSLTVRWRPAAGDHAGRALLRCAAAYRESFCVAPRLGGP